MCAGWCQSNWLWVAHLLACVKASYSPKQRIQLKLLCYVRYVIASRTTVGSFDCKDTLLSPSLLEQLPLSMCMSSIFSLSLSSFSFSFFLPLSLFSSFLSALHEANPSKTHHRISGMDTRGMFAMCVLCFTRLPLSVFLPPLDDASFLPVLSSFPLPTHSFHCTASGSTDWFNSTTLWPLLL